MIKIGQNILLEITRDGLSAYITLCKNEDGSHIEEDLIKYMDEITLYIKYGLDKDLLMNILEEKIINKKTLIAEGQSPIDGKNGKIKYLFDMEKPLLPKLRKDGTVDYRELDAINRVKKDQILAELILPTDGSPGFKVNGEEIPCKKGKTPKFKYGKNIRLSSDGKSLLGDCDGLVEIKNGKVSVSDLLQIENVDSSIGHIKFDGNVIVDGDILNGFYVKATGSVEVKGAVEGGFIQSNENILIRQGIQGYNKLTIDADGNLGTKFIENSIVHTEGNIISEAIMHSNVYSHSCILVLGKRGLIVGGISKAACEIRARIIGSSMCTSTTLEVGVNPALKLEHDELKEKIKVARNNLYRIQESLSILEPLNKAKKLNQKQEKLYEKFTKAKLSLNIEINNFKKRAYDIKTEMDRNSKGKIKVSDIIYPGVKVVIGNAHMFIKDEMKRCTFYNENGVIKIGAY